MRDITNILQEENTSIFLYWEIQKNDQGNCGKPRRRYREVENSFKEEDT